MKHIISGRKNVAILALKMYDKLMKIGFLASLGVLPSIVD
jgi:hypothetical protein